MKRTDNTRLPGHDELSEILEREEYRPVAVGKENIHYPEFSTIIALLSQLELASDLFTEAVASIHEAVAAGDLLLAQIVSKLSGLKLDGKTLGLLDGCYGYLAEEDVPQPSDLIFVFGGKTPSRPEVAARLYQQGLAAAVWMSGGNAIYAQDKTLTEAEIYRGIAIEHGVPADAISTERTSITVPDNVRVSLNLLDAMSRDINSLIIVNSPYTQRRGWALFKKHLADDVAVYRVNCATKPEFSRENWYKQDNTLRVVLNEYMKMRASVVYNTA
jgi:hypothetical protein